MAGNLQRIISGWVLLSLAITLMACAPTGVKNVPASVENAPAIVKNDYRTDDEIQAVFDQNKSILYSVYQRFLQRYGVFEAHIIFSITIEPSGEVSDCGVHRTTLSNPALGKSICKKIRLLNFGPKNLSRISITYPIDFLPR